MECLELNSLCKYMKKVTNNQAAILVLNWIKLSFSLWVSLKHKFFNIQIFIRRSITVQTILDRFLHRFET